MLSYLRFALLLSCADAFSLDPDWARKEVGAKYDGGKADLVLLTDASEKTGAKCLDGTPGAYYWRPGSGDGMKKWYIHHEGGGWCTDLDDCKSRSGTDLGSSKAYPASQDLGGGYFSADPAANPMMYNWNSVILRYCDGGSFSGLNDSITQHDGVELYFRGRAILEAMQQSLLSKGLNVATDVVISGCSAGGLATYLHVDNWAKLLSPRGIRVVGMPDSGFFLDHQAAAGSGHASDCEGHYHEGLKWVFKYMNSTSGVNEKCIEAHWAAGDTWRCMFAQHTAPHILTPTFALQGTFDSWQMECDLQSQDQSKVNEWGENLTRLMENNFLATNKEHGAFLDSCNHHCGGWNLYYANGKSQAAAFQEWYHKGSEALANDGFFAQAQKFPCEDCCKAPPDGENLWRQSTHPVVNHSSNELLV